MAGSAGRRFTFSGDESLENVLGELQNDDTTLADLGARSRRRVEERFLWSDVADAYEDVLRELC